MKLVMTLIALRRRRLAVAAPMVPSCTPKDLQCLPRPEG